MGVNEGVNFTPRGQISPLGAKFTPRGEIRPWGPGVKFRLALWMPPWGLQPTNGIPMICQLSSSVKSSQLGCVQQNKREGSLCVRQGLPDGTFLNQKFQSG
jgi:hypothetical protein